MEQMNFDKYASIMPFQFIVESTSEVGIPLIYACSPEIIEMGTNGRKRVSTLNTEFYGDSATAVKEEAVLLKELKGYTQLIDDYIYYQDHYWLEEKVITDNNGVLTFNWNEIL